MDDLPSILQAELDASRDFLSLLKDEESALATGDSERLSGIVQSKSEKIQDIARLAHERDRLVPLKNMADWLEGQPESSKIWGELIALSREIKQANEINGKMIDVRMRSTQQALNMLQSLASKTSSLYGPDGQASMQSGGHSINSA